MDNIASGNIKNQHRAYIETGTTSDTRYIFEELKLGGPFSINGVSVTAEQYVRSKFLAMYQSDPAFFWNSNTIGWWQSVNPSLVTYTDFLSFINSPNRSYTEAWLNFIKVQ